MGGGGREWMKVWEGAVASSEFSGEGIRRKEGGRGRRLEGSWGTKM